MCNELAWGLAHQTLILLIELGKSLLNRVELNQASDHHGVLLNANLRLHLLLDKLLQLFCRRHTPSVDADVVLLVLLYIVFKVLMHSVQKLIDLPDLRL